MGDWNVNITPTDVFKWQSYQNMVETEGLLWLKQDWRLVSQFVWPMKVQFMTCNKILLIFRLTHDKELEFAMGLKSPSPDWSLQRLKNSLPFWKGKGIWNVAWKGAFSSWVQRAEGHVLQHVVEAETAPTERLKEQQI